MLAALSCAVFNLHSLLTLSLHTRDARAKRFAYINKYSTHANRSVFCCLVRTRVRIVVCVSENPHSHTQTHTRGPRRARWLAQCQTAMKRNTCPNTTVQHVNFRISRSLCDCASVCVCTSVSTCVCHCARVCVCVCLHLSSRESLSRWLACNCTAL